MRVALFLAVLASACSSLVDTPCSDGHAFRNGACVVDEIAVDAGVDSPVGVVVDAAVDAAAPNDAMTPVDAPACASLLATDPQNCGMCGRVCPSGICEAGQCLGELPGHIVLIGHDYRSHNVAMARVLGNAIALGVPDDLGVARLAGSAIAQARSGTSSAIAQSLAAIGKTWHAANLPAPGSSPVGIHVLVVDAQLGDGDSAQALGTTWKPTIDALLAARGVVVILEGAGGVGHRFAAGAGLFAVTPQDATGTPAFVADANDAIVQQVVSPYLADSTSSEFPGVTGPIATPSGAIVVHFTR